MELLIYLHPSTAATSKYFCKANNIVVASNSATSSFWSRQVAAPVVVLNSALASILRLDGL